MNVAFVPVRCGSKSIPFKNIKSFCGKPLLYWSVKALQESISIDEIYIGTDCDEIKDVVKDFNFSKVKIFNRSKENAGDTSSSESVLLEFINQMNFNRSDIFFLVQATSPLVRSTDFDKAYTKYKEDGYDSLLTCVRTKRFFWKDDFTPLNYDFRHRPRRQDFNGILLENGAFYINTVENIVEQRNRLTGNIGIFEMDEFTAIEIDEDDDWIIAEKLMKKYILIDNNKQDIKLFLSDIDGTLTDAGMYYSEDGNELKKFNTHDGKGFELLRKKGVKTGIITSENTQIVKNRADKLKVDYLYQGLEHKGKLNVAKEICAKEGIQINNVAYIGDDVNCKELLEKVGLAACPKNSMQEIKEIPNIIKLDKKGGDGAVREFIELILVGR